MDNKLLFWGDKFIYDLRIVASINFFLPSIQADIILVPDLNVIPVTTHVCKKHNIELIEYYVDEPSRLVEGIDAYVQNRRKTEFIILQYIASNIHLISSLLVSKGFEVIDRSRQYPELYFPGTVIKSKGNRISLTDGRCPECDSDNLVYQEGVLICLNCGFNMEG